MAGETIKQAKVWILQKHCSHCKQGFLYCLDILFLDPSYLDLVWAEKEKEFWTRISEIFCPNSEISTVFEQLGKGKSILVFIQQPELVIGDFSKVLCK